MCACVLVCAAQIDIYIHTPNIHRKGGAIGGYMCVHVCGWRCVQLTYIYVYIHSIRREVKGHMRVDVCGCVCATHIYTYT